MLKCSMCVDEAIMNTSDEAVVVADAITLVPVVQVLQLSIGTVASVVALPVCLEHRKQQMSKQGKSGLAVA